MKVLGIRFLGVRTEQHEELTSLMRDVMGMKLTREKEDLTGLQLDDGTTVEVYGPGDADHVFFGNAAVVGFLVDDFDAARAEMESVGVDFLGRVQHEAGTSWNHFRGPDGNIYEIIGPGKETEQ